MGELRADRNMIHHLLKEELKTTGEVSEFNYILFTGKYNLKTVANGTMVIDEYNAVINEVTPNDDL